MPAVSKKQFRFFKYLENTPEAANEHGMTTAKAAEMTKENTGSKRFAKLKEFVKKKKG